MCHALGCMFEAKEDYLTVKNRLKATSTLDDLVTKDDKEVSRCQVRPILKKNKSEEIIEGKPSSSPPKSILKQSGDFEQKEELGARDNVTPRPILKHNEFETHSYDAHSILKPAESTVVSPRAGNVSPPKSILKHNELESNHDPKSILKPQSEDTGATAFQGKTILKTSQDFESVSNVSPKSILKKGYEAEMSPQYELSSKSEPKPWMDKTEKSPTKTDLLSNVQLDSSDSEEQAERDKNTDKILRPKVSSPDRPVPTPRKSILKNSEVESSNLPKAEQSSHSPSCIVAVPAKLKQTDTSSAISENNFSAFTLNDSIDMINVQDVQKGGDISNICDASSSSSTNKTKGTKPAWQIEMEARQGIRQKEAKGGVTAARKNAGHAQPKNVQHSKEDSETKNNLQSKDFTKPAWQLEAKKRQAARNGQYRDPELPHSSPPQGKKVQPPRPKNPPNFHARRPAPAPPSSQQQQKPDPFGRTEDSAASNKGLNRTPAFKISPESSPQSEPKTKTHTEAVADWQKEAQRRQKVIGDGGFKDPEFVSRSEFLHRNDQTDHVDREVTQPNKKKIIPDTRFSFSELKYDVDNGNDVGMSSPRFRNRPLPSPPQSVVKRKVNTCY